MKASDAIIQLQVVLPTVTDDFSTQIAITSITPAGTTATATTAAPHPFAIGNVVNITGTLAPVVISSISRSETVATVVTATPHDITEGFHDEVTISGANESEFNGTFPLISAINRKTFAFTVPDSGATVGTGSMLLEDPPSAFGYNGLIAITAVPASNQFEYELPLALTEPAVGSGVVHSDIRVTGAVSIERAVDMYTEQPDQDSMWAFVVLGDTIASKDRNTKNDATTSAAPGSDRRQQIYQTFSVYVFKPSTEDLSGREARDDMEDVMLSLFKSLLYWVPLPTLSSQSGLGVIFVSHGFEQYNTAFYIHEFQFQLVTEITRNDTIDPDFNVAFRDISLTMQTSLGTEQLTADIDLDDVPLP
ncbi:MAG: hypothetical protein V3V40_05855 [Nitrosomonadaceae bacterium]